ncbi:hypothetical protein KY285_020867 [Solanum tuberosum]|nr:hypothetical protein KY285_020867 [Solanum tuberosum]
MGVKLYVEIKKQEVGFSMYPLCVDTSDKSEEEIQGFDASSGAIVCMEEMEIANYISNTNITEVETKATLVTIMAKYKIKHSFNFRVKRSDTNSGVTAPKLVNHKRKHTPNDIIDDVREMYGVEISYQQAWCAKERALELLRDKPAD